MISYHYLTYIEIVECQDILKIGTVPIFFNFDASGGSNLKMEKAYIDEENAQAICSWDAPDRKSVEDLFSKAQVTPESIRQVTEYSS